MSIQSENQMTSVEPLFLNINYAKVKRGEMSLSFKCCIIEIVYAANFKSYFKIRYIDEELILESTSLNTFLTDYVGVSWIIVFTFSVCSYDRPVPCLIGVSFSCHYSNLVTIQKNLFHIWVLLFQNLFH